MISKLKKLANIIFFKNEPTSIVHFLTNRCNARCSFCFIDFENPETFSKELTLNEIDILTQNLGESLINVNFTGGEPFARKDIIEIAKLYLKNSSISSIYLTTNGSLPDRIEEFIQEIKKINSKIELNFQISIDSFPDQHDKIRKIDGLFEKCIESYFLIKNFNLPNINSNVAITVSEENYENIKEIYNYLFNIKHIKNIKCTLVRDEGVYKINKELKNKILDSYIWLTRELVLQQKKGENLNYGNSLQSKLHRKKDEISYNLVSKIFPNKKFISTCHASSLFGVITSKGDVFPCEILEDQKIGNLRENNMNFIKLWKSKKNKLLQKHIKKTNCTCTYECGLSFNIAGNYRYYPSLIRSIF